MRRYSGIIILAFVWSSYYIAVSQANGQLDSFVTGSCVRFFCFALLTGYMLYKKCLGELLQVGSALPRLLLIGCCGFLLDITAFIGFKYSSAATGTLLLRLDVVMVNVMSIFIYNQRFRARDWLFTFVMLAGALMVLGVKPADITFRPTDILFILSALFISINVFLVHSVQTRKDVKVSNYTIAYYNNFVTMLLFIVSALFAGSFANFQQPASGAGALAALAVGGAGQFFIYIFYYKALNEHPVWLVKVILLLIPVFTLASEALFFGERPDLYMLCGTVVALVGAAGLILNQKSGANVVASEA